MKLIHIFLMAVLFLSCSSPKKNKLKNFMIGSWQTEYMRIEMPTADNTDSLSVYEERFSKRNVYKAQAAYNKNGTFLAWYRSYKGEKSAETFGDWHVKGDSLYVDYFYHGKQVKAWYLIKKTKMGFDGKMVYDWDEDGKFDDTLFVKNKRIILD